MLSAILVKATLAEKWWSRSTKTETSNTSEPQSANYGSSDTTTRSNAARGRTTEK